MNVRLCVQSHFRGEVTSVMLWQTCQASISKGRRSFSLWHISTSTFISLKLVCVCVCVSALPVCTSCAHLDGKAHIVVHVQIVHCATLNKIEMWQAVNLAKGCCVVWCVLTLVLVVPSSNPALLLYVSERTSDVNKEIDEVCVMAIGKMIYWLVVWFVIRSVDSGSQVRLHLLSKSRSLCRRNVSNLFGSILVRVWPEEMFLLWQRNSSTPSRHCVCSLPLPVKCPPCSSCP